MSDDEKNEDFYPPATLESQREIAELPFHEQYDEDGNPVGGAMGQVFTTMVSRHNAKLSVPKSNRYTRQQVVNAFHDSFELIGGVPRLAAWAHLNPDKFFQLYAKLLPSQAQSEVKHDGVVKIVHALAPNALDSGRVIEHGTGDTD
ncbi:MAG: hypothetical protein E6Q97_07595 [Desulfurellales bacterium]|nr:MAG: hypothetical protein E6Q97_07595 [Desulfurellales bacterium]